MGYKYAPLPAGFMITSFIGFMLAVMVLNDYSTAWAFIVGTFSVILFLASLLSMTYAPVEDEILMDSPYERKKRTRIISAQEALKLQKRKRKK